MLSERYARWVEEKEIFVTMRDGVRLSTDVLLPEGASRRFSTVLVRTPYHKDAEIMASANWIEFFVRHGYAVVLQSERGTFYSEGEFTDFLESAKADGYDTIDWIVRQPWSNGKIGTIGCSSSAENQWPLAAGNHPGHAAMIPAASGMAVGNIPGNYTRGAFYRGGVPYVFGLWVGWYASTALKERLLLPPESTQDQRIRLRQGYSLQRTATSNAADPSKLAHLPVADLLREAGGPRTPWDEYITCTPNDARWDQVEHIGHSDRPLVPALHINTWHDVAVCETTRLFKHLQDQGVQHQYMIIGAGEHCVMCADRPYELKRADLKQLLRRGEGSELEKVLDVDMSDLRFGDLQVGDARYRGVDNGWAGLYLDWFAHWLDGVDSGITEMPKIQLFVIGQGWISGDKWPLEGTRFTRYYLGRDDKPTPDGRTGSLTTIAPSYEVKDSYLYDPSMPVPSLGAGFGCSLSARNHREIEARRDVLVYCTPPLSRPITIAGPIEVNLYVSSSAKDTDFMIKLLDVYPDGTVINLSDDAFRVRFREGFDKTMLMRPDEIYLITLSHMVTAVRFAEGHQIQLNVASSNFPLFERNLNTGGNNFDETTFVVAENFIHHGPHHPSHVLLPIIQPHD